VRRFFWRHAVQCEQTRERAAGIFSRGSTVLLAFATIYAALLLYVGIRALRHLRTDAARQTQTLFIARVSPRHTVGTLSAFISAGFHWLTASSRPFGRVGAAGLLDIRWNCWNRHSWNLVYRLCCLDDGLFAAAALANAVLHLPLPSATCADACHRDTTGCYSPLTAPRDAIRPAFLYSVCLAWHFPNVAARV